MIDKENKLEFLKRWFAENAEALRGRGVSWSQVTLWRGGASSIEINGNTFVGTITHWLPNKFEFQFNSASTGEVLLLETDEIDGEKELVESLKQRLVRVSVEIH
jgi:hypothetical protein